MKIKEYAASVNEYTEVVETPFNFTEKEEVLDERPMGFVKGGLQKLGAKVLPGSYGRTMTGKVKLGTQANKLYGDFHEFLGQSGYKSTDDALKAFLQQSGINVDIDSILKGIAPAPQKTPPTSTPAPVTESINTLDRILILSGRSPKNIINEEIALDRGALNKIFMQVAQQQMGGKGGAGVASSPAPTTAAPAPAGKNPAAPKSTAPAANRDFGGEGPAAPAASSAPPVQPPTAEPATSSAPPVQSPTANDINAQGPTGTAPAKTQTGTAAAALKKTDQATQNASADKVGQTLYAQIKSQINNLDKKGKQRILQLLTKSLQQSAAPKASPAAAPTPATAANKGFKVGADELKQRRQQNIDNDRETTAGLGYNESKILDRNSYVRLKDLLEKADLTLRDFEYRVSITESTPNSVTLIPR